MDSEIHPNLLTTFKQWYLKEKYSKDIKKTNRLATFKNRISKYQYLI